MSLAAEGGSKSGREPRAPDYRLGWIAVLAAIVGAVVVVLLRQDPFENPDSRAFEAIALHVTHTDQPPGVDWAYTAEHPEMGEVGFDRYYSRAAIDAIRARPGAFVRRLARGAFEYLGPLRDRRPDTWLHRFARLSLLLGLAWEDSRRRLALPARRDAHCHSSPAPGTRSHAGVLRRRLSVTGRNTVKGRVPTMRVAPPIRPAGRVRERAAVSLNGSPSSLDSV